MTGQFPMYVRGPFTRLSMLAPLPHFPNPAEDYPTICQSRSYT